MFIIFAWLFAAAVALHNLEEAVWLPAWSNQAVGWLRPVGVGEFRFAVVVLSILAFAAALLATVQGQESFGAYLLAGYALAMLLNVAFPHLLATIVMRRYMPGTGTALVLNLPVSATLLNEALQERYITATTFAWTGPAIVLALVASIPLLFHIGRTIPLGVNRNRKALD
jgi:uncharacterized protein with HXXEE motif